MKTIIKTLFFSGLLLFFIAGCGGDDGGGSGAPSSIAGNQLGLDGDDAFARQEPICTPDHCVAVIPPPSPLDVSTFTIEAWIFPTENKTMTIASDSAYSLDVIFQSGESNGGLGIGWTLFNTTHTAYPHDEFRGLQLNQWNHVAGMFDDASN